MAKKKVVKAVLKEKKSPAQEYLAPNLFTVTTQLTADEPVYTPVYNEEDVADVKIVVPTLNHLQKQDLRLNHRTTSVMDCGITIELPKGFQLRGITKKEWALRGLFVSLVYIENKRLKLMITNIGQETPLVIPHQSVIAQIWVEPVYYFRFNL